jgi:methionyl aminopeptidase
MNGEVRGKLLEAGKIGKEALEFGKTLAEPGALLIDIASRVEAFIRDSGGKPSFPVNLSVNNEAAHYTPYIGDRKKLFTGDILKIDVGAQVDGYLSDNAATVEVGNTGKYSDLIDSTREALNRAIKKLRPGIRIRDIGAEIGMTIESYGFKPVRNLGGHGINRYDLHSSIFIPNFDDGNGDTIRPDMTIAIEPFASTGSGMIHHAAGGNIYILDSPRIDHEEIIYRNFNTVPFAERWLQGLVPDPQKYLREMMKKRQISHFPVLKEHRGSIIAQSEHTIVIGTDGITVTTA